MRERQHASRDEEDDEENIENFGKDETDIVAPVAKRKWPSTTSMIEGYTEAALIYPNHDNNNSPEPTSRYKGIKLASVQMDDPKLRVLRGKAAWKRGAMRMALDGIEVCSTWITYVTAHRPSYAQQWLTSYNAGGMIRRDAWS